MAVFIILLTINSWISLGTLLDRENIEGMVWFFSKLSMQMYSRDPL